MVKGFRCQVSGKAKISRVGLDSAELVAGCADHIWRYTILLIRRAQRPALLFGYSDVQPDT